MARTNEIFLIDGDAVMKRTASGVRPAGAASGPLAATLVQPRSAAVEGKRSSRPAAAATLSMWIWGSGQLLNGDRDLAVLLALWQVQIAALHYLVCMTWGSLTRLGHLFFVSEWEMLLASAALDFWFIFLWLFNVSQAYRSAERRRGVFTGLRRWYVSGLASLLIPGWGQILNGQRIKGLCFLFAYLTQGWVLAFYLLTPLYRLVSDLDPNQTLLRLATRGGEITLMATALLWLVSVYDAVLVARITRTRAR
jgi:TM2 domain-containing membrane protein YozV